MMKTKIIIVLCYTNCLVSSYPIKKSSQSICTPNKEINCHVDDHLCYTNNIHLNNCKK